MADKQNDEPRHSSDRRPPPMGGNLLWYALALGIGTLFVVSLFSRTPLEISYMELVRLIEQGSPQKTPEAAIVVIEGTEPKALKVRYSNLGRMKIGPTEIAGELDRQVIDPEKERTQPQRKVFR